MDIVEVEKQLDETVAHYKEQMLNDLPEFGGLNPSIEHFARILAEQLNVKICAPNLACLTVRIWENEIAWVSYQVER